MDVQSDDLITSALRGAANKLAQDPVLIDVSQRLGIAESFLVVSAPSSRQVRAIAEEIMDEIGRDLRGCGRIKPSLVLNFPMWLPGQCGRS